MKRKLTKGRVNAPRSACPECGLKDVRYLRRTDTWYCRHCGCEWGRDWVDSPKVSPKRKAGK